MDHLGQQGGSITSKVAAAFEQRIYPEYADLIIRLFAKVEIDGSNANMLKEEMELTSNFLKKNLP